MKRNLLLGFAALTTFALPSCQKAVHVEDSPNMVTVTLVADKAGDDTRAAAVEGENKVSYVWTDTDIANLKLFVVTTEMTTGDDPKEEEVLTEVVNPTIDVSTDNKTLTITATVAENSTLRAAVTSEWTGKEGDKNRKPRLPSTQRPLVDNFDPNADILVAEDVTVSELVKEKLTFHRPVTINKMTLKGLASNETISKVVLSSEKHLTGYYKYDTGAMSAQQTELTVKYEPAVMADANGVFPVYFVTMPNVDHTITLTVETSKNSKKYRYSKTFGTVSFNKGKFSTFSVDLSGCGEEIVDVNYSGEWIIAGTDSNHSIAATGYSSGNVYPASEVNLDEDDEVVTVYSETTDPFKMTISLVTAGDNAGLYTIMDANGKYLSATGGTKDNNMKGLTAPDADQSYWSIVQRTDGTFDIIAANLGDDGKKYMRVNYNNGTPRVTCYGSSSNQPRPVLYPFDKAVVGEPPIPTYDFESVAELNELVTNSSSSYSGYLTDAVVSFVPAANVAIIKDATGSVMYYKSSHGLKQGQTYTGAIDVTAIKYNGLYSEITAISGASFSGSQTTVNPESIALADLIGNYDDYQNAYVSVAGLTVVSIGSNNKDINVTDGSNNYVVFYNPGSPSCLVGDVITAIGTVTKYQTTEEIKVWAAADLVVTASSPKAVTFTQPSEEGCSIAVSVGGSAISSGTTVVSGTTVTLTATAGDEYSFIGWNVTGANVTDASSATTTFTMGASEVVISASFVSSGGEGGTLIIDFESDSATYTDWTFNNMTSQQTESITAHGGTNYGTTGGKTTAYVVTKNKIQYPGTLTVYFSKQTTNSSSSTWYIQVSSDGSTWTDVKTQSATSMSKGEWVEVSQDLSSYSNVYVRVYYSGSTAVRNIDDLSLTYN